MAHDPQRRGQQDSARRSQQDPGRVVQGDPARGSTARQGDSATATATLPREGRARQAPPPRDYREDHARAERGRKGLVLAGVLGLLLLGGLIAGLVASHAPSTRAAHITPRTLSVYSGRGDRSAPSFTAPSSVTSHYSYRCPAGTTGQFFARVENSSGSDILPIVRSTALSGSGATTVHPLHVGTPYHVAVGAPSGGCTYHITSVTP